MAYGTVNADVIGTSVSGSNLGAGNASIMKNRIINGSMVIDQRNAGASLTVPLNFFLTYSLDRWSPLASVASKYTVQQNAGSVTPPVGFNNYLGATSSSAYSVVAGDYFGIGQRIEGFNFADLNWGTANAKTITISAWVYSSLTGTFGGVVQNSAQTRSYPFTYSISTANTWTQISVTIAGDTSGTWIGATNGVGLTLVFSIGTGSTLSGTAGAWAASNYVSATGATSVVGTSGATFYITGVQLEVGSSATGYEYRQYGTELSLCQRYYSTSFPYGTAPVQNSGLYTWKVSMLSSGYGTFNQIQYPVPMRITATTITGYNGGATNTLVRNVPAATDITNLITYPTSTTGFVVQCYGGAGDGTGNPIGWNWSASAEL
jgi:hypothetical protein